MDHLPELGKALLLVAAYYLTAALSLKFFAAGPASPLWAPAAIALCACLAWGLRMVPAAWLGAALIMWSAGPPFWVGALTALGVTLETVVAVFLIRRMIGMPVNFSDTRNIFRLVGIAAVSSVLSATIGVSVLALTGHLDSAGMGQSWLTWWLGDTTGIIIVAPLILTWSGRFGSMLNRQQFARALLNVLILALMTHLVFGNVFGPLPLAFLPITFVMWAAFRFSLPAVTWINGLICAIAIWHTLHGTGPFAMPDLNMSLLILGVYSSVLGTVGLSLASLVSRARITQEKLRQERDFLEQRVQERTAALVRDIEERKRIERELAARERQLADAQSLAQVGSWNLDIEANTISWSDELYRIFGVTRENFDVTRENCKALIHEDDIAPLQQVVLASRATGEPFDIEHRVILPSGETRMLAARGYVTADESGRVVRMFGTTRDITDAKRAELALREAEERYRLVVELCPDAILVQQDDNYTFGNPAATALLGAGTVNLILGRPVLGFVHPDFHEIVRQRHASLVRGDSVPRSEEKFLRLDDTPVDVEVHSSSFMYRGKFAALLIARDITERKKSAEQLAWLAHYDSLTALPNRILFHQRLAHAMRIAERPGRSLEVLFLDLDHFKQINDTLGHATGDWVLQETAERLQGSLRESDTVARLGGDEFVVLVENVDEPHRGGFIAEKILAAMKRPFINSEHTLNITTSIGISSFPTDGIDADALLKKADTAMYRAKQSGRNAYRYYSEEMNLHTSERLRLEEALRDAIRHDQLSLHYQPKVDMLSRRITGMEALLRWNHPALGSVPPQRFIPLAEETGLIHAIGKWAIRAACIQNRLWQDANATRLKVAVNLSPLQMSDDNLIADIREILDDTALDPAWLELEITESTVMANPDKAIVLLKSLRDIGISVAIDDFGIGYSSLAYLKRFPIQAVKIDRSFVQGVPQDHGDAAITKAIIGLAHSLECTVIAEGAETQQQVDFLHEHECDTVQGYFFSAPVNADRFGELLRMEMRMPVH
nr:EAL domain-containing protein [Noviherbaspirillum cavernae]